MTDTRKDIRDQLFVENIVHYEKVIVSLRETIRSLRVGEVDGVIDVNGGWPIK
jgi:hypothetical protein